MQVWKLGIGATVGDKATFKVWAPNCTNVKLKLDKGSRSQEMGKDGTGYFEAAIDRVSHLDRYLFNLGTGEYPDPVSRFQPEGPHKASAVIDPNSSNWTDKDWKGVDKKDLIIYELHIGTFTKEGTFEAAIGKLPYLSALGINCIELMPIAQFPGTRGWGYDGVNLYAPQNTYGGPEGLKRFVDVCHKNNIAVCLDVVYNHLGPEGNYLSQFGPYFSKANNTPWGEGFNLDTSVSEPIRKYIISNALYWISEYHIDALRLDAANYIQDKSTKHILKEIKEEVDKLAGLLGRKVVLIAESYANDPTLIEPEFTGGYGLDAVWANNFEHALYVTLTGKNEGWYEDYVHGLDLHTAFSEPFVFHGNRHSKFYKRAYGGETTGLSNHSFVVYSESHDTVGNNPRGERFSHDLPFSTLKLSSGITILSPYVPMLFMGTEFGSNSPFLFFNDFENESCRNSSREGRLKWLREFGYDGWSKSPDPANIKSFINSKINWDELKETENRQLLIWHMDLISFRRDHLVPHVYDRANVNAIDLVEGAFLSAQHKQLAVEYKLEDDKRVGIVHSFSDKREIVTLPFTRNTFEVALYSGDTKYGGVANFKGKKFIKDITLEPHSTIVGFLHEGKEEQKLQERHLPRNIERPQIDDDEPKKRELVEV